MRVELVGITAEQVGQPVDHRLVQEVLEIVVVQGARLQRPSVHDDGGPATGAVARYGAGQWNRGVFEDVGVEGRLGGQRGYVLHEEVDIVQLGHPVRFEVVQDVHQRLVEALRGGSDERHAERGQLPA